MQDNNILYHKCGSRKVTLFQGFLIFCVMGIIGLSLLPTTIFVLAKVEKVVASGNDSNIVNAFNNKGLALEKLGNDTGAIFFYKKALAIHILNNIGMTLDSLGNYTGAVEYFNRALAVNPNDEAALYNKGAAFLHLGIPTL